MSNWYAGLGALRRRLGLTDTSDDPALRAIIEHVSRAIDQWTGRHFYVWTGSRAYSTTRPDCLQLEDDLLAVSALATDTDGDLSYGTSWTTADYALLPANAPSMSPPRPYWQIQPTPLGAQAFATGLLGVQITGRWGYYDVPQAVASTLAEAVDVAETTIDVDDGTDFDVGQTLLLESEQVFVTDISMDTLTVERGVNGTTPAPHAIMGPVAVATYPVIGEACLLQAEHQFHLKDAPGGVIGGGGEFGPIRVSALHPTVRLMLQGFRRHGIV